MNIAIIDADLTINKRHRFPNLACMKISGWHKNNGDTVELKLNYTDLEKYNIVYISKVFSETEVPIEVLSKENVKYGGTGFYYDKAPPLPQKIEHHMPDYGLYDKWVKEQVANGEKEKSFEYYTDYSIGFTTRGCFRRCSFCVNKNYTKVSFHSPIEEFLDKDKKKICLLDDNILGYSKWKGVLEDLQKTKKPFQYKQGMDIRIMTEEKADVLSKSKYCGDYIFAFDNINERKEIEEKIKLWKKYTNKNTKMYVFCGFDRNDKYDEEFWIKDIEDTFKRVYILAKYNCAPYIMRYKKYNESPYRGIYINIASWCNQKNLFLKMTFNNFCIERGMNQKIYKEYKNNYQAYLDNGYKKGSTWRYLEDFNYKYPEFSKRYFHVNTENIDEINKATEQ